MPESAEVADGEACVETWQTTNVLQSGLDSHGCAL